MMVFIRSLAAIVSNAKLKGEIRESRRRTARPWRRVSRIGEVGQQATVIGPSG